MAGLRDETRSYLESVLGVEAHLKALAGLKVPFHIKDAYKPLELSLQFAPETQLHMLLLLPVDDDYPGAVALKKHLNQVRRATDKVVIYVSKSLSVSERRSLIAHQINFIQPGYQMFIPELAMDLRESFRKRRVEGEITTLLPAAQAMLLGRLYEGWKANTRFTANAIMDPLKYSRVTLSKVIDQLLKLGILRPGESHGFTNLYEFGASPTEVFSKARRFLRSPVRRKVAIDRKLLPGRGVFLAGETALAQYTMLAEPAQPVYGMTKKVFDGLVKDAFGETNSIDEIRAWIEIWSYPSLKQETNLADEASLFLSLEDNPDERLQIALQEMKGSTNWLSGD
ncbi:hypothetical protein NG726_04285 [Pseudomonas sp. MOB-449]|nr:hypothetical protein [Pseudomonas sp. MOB-449]